LCLYFTKLAPISKTDEPRAERVVRQNLILRSNSAPPPASQSLGGHRKKTLLAFLICARGILFEKGKGVFLLVFCLQRFGQAAGLWEKEF